MTDKRAQFGYSSSYQRNYIKVKQDGGQVSFEDSKYGNAHLKVPLTSANASFKTSSTIDEHILTQMYMQSMNEWTQGGDYSFGSALSHMKNFTSLLQSSSDLI